MRTQDWDARITRLLRSPPSQQREWHFTYLMLHSVAYCLREAVPRFHAGDRAKWPIDPTVSGLCSVIRAPLRSERPGRPYSLLVNWEIGFFVNCAQSRLASALDRVLNIALTKGLPDIAEKRRDDLFFHWVGTRATLLAAVWHTDPALTDRFSALAAAYSTHADDLAVMSELEAVKWRTGPALETAFDAYLERGSRLSDDQ